MRFLTIFGLIFFLSGCNDDTEKKSTDTQETTDAVEKPLTDWVQGEYLPSKNFANICMNPRQNSRFSDLSGTYKDENNWIRSWSHETYLWYNELPDVDPASIQDPIKYFDQMKTSATTSSGLAKDRFHFTVDTAESRLLSETGISVGYGASAKQDTKTGRVYVTYTEPNSPARNANISRGTEILAAGGINLNSNVTDEELDIFNSALFPVTSGESHIFTIKRPDSILIEDLILTSSATTEFPVYLTTTFEANGEKIGYLVLNSFNIETAELQLINAVSQLKSAQISDLILDLRYNGGGYLGISGVLGTMIAGNKANGEIFGSMVYNDKYTQYDPIYGQLIKPFLFPETSLGFSSTKGTPLPKLNLSRVFIIATGDTASASEALINSLRGIDVEVILIGETTTGKPYGFYGTDNCGTTYYTIQYKGNNAKGYGDYADGFIPSVLDNGTDRVKGCLVADDLSSALGNINEKMLGTAIHYIANNNCPTETMPLRTKHSLLSSVRGDVIRRHPTEVIMLR
jgi:C-terminal processing protease CtpA/Prc